MNEQKVAVPFFERKNLAVAVICGVHALEVRILVEYRLARLEAIVEYGIRLDAQPSALVIDGADGDARMRKHLMRNGLHLARLDVEPPLELGDGAKGPHLRVSLFVDRCEEIGGVVLEVSEDLVHSCSLLVLPLCPICTHAPCSPTRG